MDYQLDFTDKYMELEYGKVNYLKHEGKGPSIVFVHGLGSNARTWRKLVGYLPDELGIYLLNLAGHGKSDAPSMDYTLKKQIDALTELIRSEGLSTPYLFGHSYGGWICATYAQGQHELSGLVLEDSVGLEVFSDERKAEPGYKERLLKEALQLNPNEQVIRSIIDLSDAEAHLTQESLKRVRCKTLILWGSNDDMVDPKYANSFNELIKGSRLEMIADGDHTPHYVKPEETAERLLKFIG